MCLHRKNLHHFKHNIKTHLYKLVFKWFLLNLNSKSTNELLSSKKTMNTKWLEFEFIFLHKRKEEIRDKAHLKEFLEYMCKKHSKAKYNLPLKMGLEYSLLFNLMSPCGMKNLYMYIFSNCQLHFTSSKNSNWIFISKLYKKHVEMYFFYMVPNDRM